MCCSGPNDAPLVKLLCSHAILDVAALAILGRVRPHLLRGTNASTAVTTYKSMVGVNIPGPCNLNCNAINLMGEFTWKLTNPKLKQALNYGLHRMSLLKKNLVRKFVSQKPSIALMVKYHRLGEIRIVGTGLANRSDLKL